MGLLRLWLAIAVVFEHAGGGTWRPLDGNLAVSAFYVISGFYIQLILSETYTGQRHWVRNFYQSRALRILPLYYVFVLISLPWALQFNPAISQTLATKNVGTVAYFWAENLLIFGQDIGRFLQIGLPNGAIHLALGGRLLPDMLPASSLPILGQSWSLAIEFGFYLLAPWLLTRRTRILVWIIAASLAIRCAISFDIGDWHYSRWWNQFFPAELGTFLIGSLACRFYERCLRDRDVTRPALAALGVIAVYSMIYRHLAVYAEGPAYGAFVVFVALAIPYLFAFTRQTDIDRFIGELSYPVYLGHIFVLQYIGMHGLVSPKHYGPAVVVGSVALAIPLVKFLEEPIAKFRHRHFTRRSALPATPAANGLAQPLLKDAP